MAVADLLRDALGGDPTIAVEAWDGSRIGPPDARTRLRITSPDAIARIVGAPGELGVARAYVAGDLELDGDVFEALEIRKALPSGKFSPRVLARAAALIGRDGLRRLPPPPEEVKISGRVHSRDRDAAAIRAHYDVSNRFYELVLGPSLTYSCALFPEQATTLEQAQAAKHELICRKLGLAEGTRLLDVGCGWGSLAIHAAHHHGATVVGVTISPHQAELARKRVVEAGLANRVEIRLQDERDVDDGPYDAISSVGMYEHVGASRLHGYFGHLHDLVRPGGRVLNHGIIRPAPRRFTLRDRLPGRLHTRTGSVFIDRYVFPDGELIELGEVVSAAQTTGLEVRHVESLREHYARTLRAWVGNLQDNWDEAVAETSPGRARVWQLYMAASAINFEEGSIGVSQVLAVRPGRGGSSGGLDARPSWDRDPLY